MRPATTIFGLMISLLVGLPPTLSEPAAAALSIQGSTTLEPLARSWIGGFRERRPDLRVELEANGTTAGLEALIDGRAHLALAARSATEAELARARERGVELERVTAARDALAVIVHRDNPVAALDRAQLRAIFSGRTSDWSAVGGERGPITVVIRNPSSHTGGFFKRQILEELPFTAAGEETRDREEMMARVAGDPGAIGFTGLADALNTPLRERLRVVPLRLDGEAESTFALSRPLFLYARAQRPEAIDDFLAFVLSADGQERILASNFFPLEPGDAS